MKLEITLFQLKNKSKSNVNKTAHTVANESYQDNF